MATTVPASFQEFAKRLNITDRQVSVVSTSRQNVVDAIGAKLELHGDQPSLLIGSYDRDTMPRYLSEGDVDVMVILHYGQNKVWDSKEGVRNSLESFKRTLKSAYPDTECEIDRNCVTMRFSEFRLDVVPAFRFSDGSYRIPDTYRGQWLPTNPIKFAAEVTRINKQMGGKFVPLIKMIKGWNREYTNCLRSFHLECIMVNHYSGYTEGYTYDSMAKVFFSKLPGYLSAATYDPISGDRVDLYLDNKSLGNDRETFKKRAQKAADLAKEAFDDTEKYPSVAIEEWRKLFGEFFPAYG